MHLSNIGKSVRLGRFMKPDGRVLITPMEALWDRPWNEVFDEVTAGGADVVLVTYGILKQYYKHVVGKLPFILTVPVETPWMVELADKVGADGVKVHYFGPFRELPGRSSPGRRPGCPHRYAGCFPRKSGGSERP